MIRHIMLCRLAPEAAGRYDEIRQALEAQLGRIPGLKHIEVGRGMPMSRRSVDLALVCDFDTREALAAYHKHPVHMQTRALVDPLMSEHWIADYEL